MSGTTGTSPADDFADFLSQQLAPREPASQAPGSNEDAGPRSPRPDPSQGRDGAVNPDPAQAFTDWLNKALGR